MSANPQLNARDRVKPIDPIWDSIRNEAEAAAAKDPLLTAFLYFSTDSLFFHPGGERSPT